MHYCRLGQGPQVIELLNVSTTIQSVVSAKTQSDTRVLIQCLLRRETTHCGVLLLLQPGILSNSLFAVATRMRATIEVIKPRRTRRKAISSSIFLLPVVTPPRPGRSVDPEFINLTEIGIR